MPESATADDAVVIEREINAPIDAVWSMWTDPEQFRGWYGPDGATIPVARFDLTPNGERVVAMRVQTPGGERSMWFVGAHEELHPPRLLVYSEAMATEDGGPPQGPTTIVRVELEELDGGRTRLRLTHQGIPADSPGAVGWNMALAKLEAAFA
jgi:uncharacterized protein YndB with AHSA1/START domain